MTNNLSNACYSYVTSNWVPPVGFDCDCVRVAFLKIVEICCFIIGARRGCSAGWWWLRVEGLRVKV
jgi:hypothetical protein